MRAIILASVLSVMAGCQEKLHDTAAPGRSVETEAPNTNYKPAFEGQTRIQGITTSTPLNVEEIAKGLSKPWGIMMKRKFSGLPAAVCLSALKIFGKKMVLMRDFLHIRRK